MKIPDKGLSKEEILKSLEAFRKGDFGWRSGRIMGYIYNAGEEVDDVISDAYVRYLTENGLDPTLYPSLKEMEVQLVAQVADLLQGDENTAGSFTSGGTESILLAVKTARDYARATKPGIAKPEMIIPRTAHAAFFKAAHYLDMKLTVVPVKDDTFLADPKAMEKAITEDTILLVGSAPSYAHGVVDPIPEIAAVAKKHGLLCHVDGCVGGIHLSYMRRLGYDVPPFDFSVDGVTSISADLHKYGYAAKNASLVLYRNRDLRKFQFYACCRWPGYTVINPTVTSSKSGGPLAAAWAAVNFIGNEGYEKIVREVMNATKTIQKGISGLGLRILGKPDMCMFSFTSDEINIYELADEMRMRKWYIQPQFQQQNSPKNTHISVNWLSVPHADQLLKDLTESMEIVRERTKGKDPLAFRKKVMKLIENFDENTYNELMKLAGIEGNRLPERWAPINEILDVLPDDFTEAFLIDYLNDMYMYSEGGN